MSYDWSVVLIRFPKGIANYFSLSSKISMARTAANSRTIKLGHIVFENFALV